MSASKYRCSFQLSVKGSWVCINAVFSPAITTPRWDVYAEAAWINQLRLWMKKKNPHIWVIVIYVWGNSPLRMTQEAESALAQFLGGYEIRPRSRLEFR